MLELSEEHINGKKSYYQVQSEHVNADINYLRMFFENLLLDKNNILNNEDLII